MCGIWWCVSVLICALFMVVGFVLMSVLLFAVMIKSVVKSFQVPVVEVVAAWLSNVSALPRTTDSTLKSLVELTLVLDG